MKPTTTAGSPRRGTPPEGYTIRHHALRGVLFTGTFVVALLVGVFFGDMPDRSATAIVLLLGLLGVGILFIPAR